MVSNLEHVQEQNVLNGNEGAVTFISERAIPGAAIVGRLDDRSRLNGNNNLDNDNGRLVE